MAVLLNTKEYKIKRKIQSELNVNLTASQRHNHQQGLVASVHCGMFKFLSLCDCRPERN